MKHVIILGGGVAGMSAAHELIERGYKVTVFEKQPAIPGGKARSVPVPGTAVGDRKPLPGEHGFRFFPGFYKHVTDTMSRIPYKNNKNGVFDNLVATKTVMMARYNQRPLVALDNMPNNLDDLKFMLQSFKNSDTGLTEEEIEFFIHRVWQLMTSCDARRLAEYERISWMEFMEADRFSEAYRQYFVVGLTRSLVAAKAEKASTRTGGDIFIQLLFNMMSGSKETDRVLNGPTNEVWIDPWLTYLRSKGVVYHFDSEAVDFEVANHQISSVTIKDSLGHEVVHTADYYLAAVPVERFKDLISSQLLKEDPSLSWIQTLAGNVSWMNGIQFYMKKETPINQGHVIYCDTEWALTSISQKQFWKDIDLSTYGNGEVKDILSVDISDWFTANKKTNQIASQSSKEDVIKGVWQQLKDSLNVEGAEILKDEDLLYVHLDGDIIFIQDPETKKYHNQNEEPLLINQTNTWDLRPDAYTRIPNLYLASDYVKTNTDLATMEGANEAARRAVNSILDASGYDGDLCKIWKLYTPWILKLYRWDDNRRFEKGLPYRDKLPWYISFLIKVFKIFV